MDETSKKYYLKEFGAQKLMDFWTMLTKEEHDDILTACKLPLDYDVYTNVSPYLEDILK